MLLYKILLPLLLLFPVSGKHLLAQVITSTFSITNEWKVLQVIDSVLFTMDKLNQVEYSFNSLFLQQLGGDVPLEKSCQVFLNKNPNNNFGWDIEWIEIISFEDNQKPVSTIFSQLHIDTVFYRRTSYYREIVEFPESRTLNKLGASWNWHELVHLHYYLKDLDSLRYSFQIRENDENPELILLERSFRNELSSILEIRTIYIDPQTWLIQGVRDKFHDLKTDLYHGFDLSFSGYRVDQPFHDSILNPTYFILQGYDARVIDIGIKQAYYDSIKSKAVLERPVLQDILNIPVIDLNGDRVFIYNEPGKWLVIDFWYYNCLPCMRSMYSINQSLKEGKYTQVQFTALNGIDSNPELLQQLAERGIEIPMYIIEREFLNTWGINSFPTFLIYDPDGRFLGAGNSNWLHKFLEELEAELE